KSALNFVDPPFDLLRRRSPAFAGRLVRLCGTNKLDLRGIPVIYQYEVVSIDLTPFAAGADVFPDWSTTTIRITDGQGRLAAEIDSLSLDDVRLLAGSHSIDLSLPEGKWQVALVTKGREVFQTRVFRVKKGRSQVIVPILTT
ncbi:MAG TPA: hypothetical protein VGO43_12315, partial [Pyrinomonadaceae bacterium]|nr:hypothetical protein [Pyrinomonadaceae bacterium]